MYKKIYKIKSSNTYEGNMKSLTRRDFIKVGSTAGIGVMISQNLFSETINNSGNKKKFAIVGVGHRTEMWQEALYTDYKENCEVVGLCDTNNEANCLDLILPCNNKGRQSLGLIFYLLAN